MSTVCLNGAEGQPAIELFMQPDAIDATFYQVFYMLPTLFA